MYVPTICCLLLLTLCLFVIIYYSKLCPIRRRFHWTLFPFIIISHFTFCPFDIFLPFDVFFCRPFVHSTFCPPTFFAVDVFYSGVLPVSPTILLACGSDAGSFFHTQINMYVTLQFQPTPNDQDIAIGTRERWLGIPDRNRAPPLTAPKAYQIAIEVP